jgi:HK97 family phage prohead protease
MKYTEAKKVELKFVGNEQDDMLFSGYAAVFNNVDSYGDRIEPGAFAKFLSDANASVQHWPRMLSNHGGYGLTADDFNPIGQWIELSEDGTGLKAVGKLADTPRGREMWTLMKMQPRMAIDGLSIGYIPKEFEPRSKPEEPRRRIKRIDLLEISVVTFPANPLARVSAVKSIGDLGDIREIEAFLREEKGFSWSEAKALISRIKQAPAGREGDTADALDLINRMGQLIQVRKEP